MVDLHRKSTLAPPCNELGMDRIADVFEKVIEHIDELREYQRG